MAPTRLSWFTVVSGLGWCLDFTIFSVLVARGVPGFAANCISAATAVTFVFFCARRWIFRDHVGSMAAAVAKYVAWNVVAISMASVLIWLAGAAIARLDLHLAIGLTQRFLPAPLSAPQIALNLAKILVTPVTMYLNFLAMGYIVERRVSFV